MTWRKIGEAPDAFKKAHDLYLSKLYQSLERRYTYERVPFDVGINARC